MWNQLKRLFGSDTCYLCGKKAAKAQRYYNDKGKPVLVCHKCRSYAERRALVKAN